MLLTILLFIDCSKMARIRYQHKESYQREIIPVKFVFFSKLVKAKKSIRWAKYVCWRIFCNFPWWLKNVRRRSKIALFSNERHFEICFPKKKAITFIWGKLSKVHKKDQILHVTTIFSLKQGETRTSHGPIPHPLLRLRVKTQSTWF